MGAFVGRRALSQIVTDGPLRYCSGTSTIEQLKLHLDSHIEFACLFVWLFFSLALVHEDFELHTTTITWHFRGDSLTLQRRYRYFSSRLSSHNIHAYLVTTESLLASFQNTIVRLSCKEKSQSFNWDSLTAVWVQTGCRRSLDLSCNPEDECVTSNKNKSAQERLYIQHHCHFEGLDHAKPMFSRSLSRFSVEIT